MINHDKRWIDGWTMTKPRADREQKPLTMVVTFLTKEREEKEKKEEDKRKKNTPRDRTFSRHIKKQ